MTRPLGFADENTRQDYGKALKEVAYLPRDLFVDWIHGVAFAAERLTEVPRLLAQVGRTECQGEVHTRHLHTYCMYVNASVRERSLHAPNPTPVA